MTNKVEFLGTAIGTAAYSGHEIAKAFDDDYSTSYAPFDPTSYGGIDAGVGKSIVIDQISISAGQESYASGNYFNRGANLWSYKTSDVSATSSLTTVDSYLSHPYLWIYQSQRNYINLQNKGVGRFHRIDGSPATDTGLAEMVFIGDFVSGVNARPVLPVISPHGGQIGAYPKVITITSQTTTAAIYYTTDGTTPTVSSTLYSGPFKISGTKTVKAIAYDASLSTATSAIATAVFTNKNITPRADLYDNRGILLEAHGGHVLAKRNKYYWYGFSFNRGQGAAGPGTAEFGSGIHCYSTTDFRTFKWESQVCAGIPLGTDMSNSQMERPHVMDLSDYNGTYVMWLFGGNGFPVAGANCLMAYKPEGPWFQVRSVVNPNSRGYKDGYCVRLGNGKNYLISDDSAIANIYIAELSKDGTQVTSNEVVIAWSGRESPILFENNGYLFLVTSQANFYDDSTTYAPKYISAAGSDPITASWSSASAASIFAEGDPLGTIYQGQPACVFKRFSDNALVYVSDAWKDNLYTSRYCLLPARNPTSSTFRVYQTAEWNILSQDYTKL